MSNYLYLMVSNCYQNITIYGKINFKTVIIEQILSIF